MSTLLRAVAVVMAVVGGVLVFHRNESGLDEDIRGATKNGGGGPGDGN